MTKKELLTMHRSLVIELQELRAQIDRVGTDGRPSGCRGVQLDRIGSAGNDPASAAAHLADGLEEMADRKAKELSRLSATVDDLLHTITDYKTYMAVRHYYVLAETDEQIGRRMCISKSRVNQIRLDFLRTA